MLSVTVYSGFIDPYYVVYLNYKIFSWKGLPQIWRLVTPFLLTGPKFGLLMDPYFLYTYGSQLETEASRFTQPGDFFVYLVFVALVILVSLRQHSPNKLSACFVLPIASASEIIRIPPLHTLSS